MLKSRETYEIMTPESIGLQRNPDDAGIMMGKHSGRNALGSRLKALGYELAGPELDDVFKWVCVAWCGCGGARGRSWWAA